jgi:hypothetical protein
MPFPESKERSTRKEGEKRAEKRDRQVTHLFQVLKKSYNNRGFPGYRDFF